ncbi:MAG: GNAT family N-acetyltransferase [Methyloceanibacter sp.]
MNGDYQVGPVETAENKSALCRDILTSLPRWFGIPESLEAYFATWRRFPSRRPKRSIGLLSLKRLSAFATEAFVLGVRSEWHRKGVGRRLFRHTEEMLRERGVRIFTVKTVDTPRRRSRLWHDT